MENQETILVTGCAGFIGFHMANLLISKGFKVVGVDSINNYYDPNLKKARLKELELNSNGRRSFSFIKLDISDMDALTKNLESKDISSIIHLAAQAGVRHSIENPYSYTKSNIDGFLNILEISRHNNIKHLSYASTSSVYGANTKVPFKESDPVNHPLQFYAATKRANELMAHSYSHLYRIPTSGIRFFTVYGPWGRPDMALFKFTKNILEGIPIDVFNHGNHTRDFTYVDDIVEGVFKIHSTPPISKNKDQSQIEGDESNSPYRIVNIGNNNPTKLMDYISAIEVATGKSAKLNLLPLQPGDVTDTYADVEKLIKEFDYKPSTDVIEGVKNFVDWYKSFYK